MGRSAKTRAVNRDMGCCTGPLLSGSRFCRRTMFQFIQLSENCGTRIEWICRIAPVDDVVNAPFTLNAYQSDLDLPARIGTVSQSKRNIGSCDRVLARTQRYGQVAYVIPILAGAKDVEVDDTDLTGPGCARVCTNQCAKRPVEDPCSGRTERIDAFPILAVVAIDRLKERARRSRVRCGRLCEHNRGQ